MINCDLCEEFESGCCPDLNQNESRFVLDAADHVAFPTLGCFIEGYLLLCPRQHVRSIASIDDFGSFAAVITSLRSSLSIVYGPIMMFEHGMGTNTNAGGCVEHAHLHMMPSNQAIDSAVRASLTFEDEIEIDELASLSGESYVSFAPSDASKFSILRNPVGLRAQYIRRIVASQIALGDSYDWASAPFLEKLRRTRDVCLERWV